MHFIGSNSRRYIAVSYKKEYLKVFQARYFFTKKKKCHGLWQNHNYVFIFPSKTYQHHLQVTNKNCKHLRSRPKQPNAFSTNPYLSLLTFSRWTLIVINRTSVQSHTTVTVDFSNLSCFILHSSYNNTWLSATRTHCLPALPAFNTRMRQNSFYRNQKWTREESFPY